MSKATNKRASDKGNLGADPLRTCLNCNAHFRGKRKLFCGERCRQIAEWVRYSRRKISEGTFDRADIQDAIVSRMGVLITGFYDKRGARAVQDDDRKRLQLIECCQNCGKNFEPDGVRKFTVQHTRVYDGFVLEAWCWQCNVDHAQSVRIELTKDEGAFVDWCYGRANSKTPTLACDDDVNWPTIWRGHLVTNLVSAKPT